ncbi:MAG: anaerobic ribonucleoside-triphosphate reductase activating protein [Thermodesulfobacteriota bacterium]
MQANLGIKGFIPTSLVDWPGKICSVLFMGGCNFRCPACHNHRLVLGPESLPEIPLEETLAYLRSRAQWIDGVTVTGGEPTLRKSLLHVLRALKDKGVRTKLDTNGSNPGVLGNLLRMGLVDAVFMDVKAPLHVRRYRAVAGVPVDLACIEESIDLLLASPIEVTFRTTVIPGMVEEPQLAEIRRRLGSARRFVVQPFRGSDTLDAAMASRDEFDMGRIDHMKRCFEVDPGPAAYPVAV